MLFAVAAVGGSCDSMEGRTGGSLVVVVDEVAVGAPLAGAALLPRVYLRAVPQEHLDDVGVAVVRGVVDGLVTAEILRQKAPRVPAQKFIHSLRPATLRGDVHGHDPARRHRIGPRAQPLQQTQYLALARLRRAVRARVPFAVAGVDVRAVRSQELQDFQLAAHVPAPRRPPVVGGVVERGPAGPIRRTRGCAVLQQESRHANLALLRRHVQRLHPEGGGLRHRRAGFQESLGDLGASPFGC